MDRKALGQLQLEILNSGVWGTIAPHSISAAKALAEWTGGRYSLLCHSADAAYEALLRHLGARLADLPHGDVVVVGEVSHPADSLVALCVGSEPLFCPNCERCGLLSPKALVAILESEKQAVRAVVLDYLPQQAEKYPLSYLAQICHEREIPLVIYAGGYLGAHAADGQPLTAYADAVIYSLGAGSAIDAGGGGLLVTDDEALWAGAFAYHNCGRAFGAGCSLVMDNILGGDMRVTEFVAATAEEILRRQAMVTPEPYPMVRMAGQPVFDSDYARRAVGKLHL